MNAGIKTCRYNLRIQFPEKKPLPESYHADYMISDLHEVPALPDMQDMIT